MPWWALALRLTGLGWYIAFCIVAGVLGGYWLDKWLGTRILFLLLGVVVGSGVAFYGVRRMVLPLVEAFGADGSPGTEGDNKR